MHLTIFNVEHGFCACAIASNGKVMLIDAGRNDTTGFSPANHIYRQGRSVELLVVSHYDEDHIADLPELIRLDNPPLRPMLRLIQKNESVSSATLRAIKLNQSGEISPAVEAAMWLIDHSVNLGQTPDLPGFDLDFYWNDFPEFDDTNNLSVVTFLSCDGVRIIFPGDLERPGWLRLVERQEFLDRLAQVNYFVASHHGRENGYCAEVLQHCWPAAVIISDSSIEHGTQMHNLYAKHASGVATSTGTRYVWTTRSDGPIVFNTGPVAVGPYPEYALF